jgi:uncharacterized protein
VSRRLMYWQVYIHKTVLAAEMMLVKLIHRAKQLIGDQIEVKAATNELDFFLQHGGSNGLIEKNLEKFCRLDDHDIMATIKNWCHHPDKILSLLCRSLVERRLLKVKLQADPFEASLVREKKLEIIQKLGINNEEADYFVFTGDASNTTYDPRDEKINILFKDGTVKDISRVDNALIHQDLSSTIKKYYFCYHR